MDRGGGSAFPVVGSDERVGIWAAQEGLSKREYFAAKALQGLLTNPTVLSLAGLMALTTTSPTGNARDCLAEKAVQYADAILVALAKKPDDPSATIKHPAPPREAGDLPEVDS